MKKTGEEACGHRHDDVNRQQANKQRFKNSNRQRDKFIKQNTDLNDLLIHSDTGCLLLLLLIQVRPDTSGFTGANGIQLPLNSGEPVGEVGDRIPRNKYFGSGG